MKNNNITIAIESTRTEVCSVALRSSNDFYDCLLSREPYFCTKGLGAMVQQLLERNTLSFSQVSRIVVCTGPGSFTALRAGIAMAQGIAAGISSRLLANSVPLLYGLDVAQAVYQSEELPKGSVLILDTKRTDLFYVKTKEWQILNGQQLRDLLTSKKNLGENLCHAESTLENKLPKDLPALIKFIDWDAKSLLTFSLNAQVNPQPIYVQPALETQKIIRSVHA